MAFKGQYKYFSQSNTPYGHNGRSFQNASIDPAGNSFACEKCLFDILHDPNEYVEISAQNPKIVELMAKQLASYSYYTNISMPADELEGYDCAKLKDQAPDWPASWNWLGGKAKAPTPPTSNVTEDAVFNAKAIGKFIVRSSDGKEALWPTQASCNQVALLTTSDTEAKTSVDSSSSSSSSSFWVLLPAGNAPWIDLGWCSPTISLNLSGSKAADWVGDQIDPATHAPLSWVYRSSGMFHVAQLPHTVGHQYGASFFLKGSSASSSANVTAVRHSQTSLEFILDGKSQGNITLNETDALPDDVVGCISMCPSSARDGNLKGVGYLKPVPGPSPTYSDVVAGPCCKRRKEGNTKVAADSRARLNSV